MGHSHPAQSKATGILSCTEKNLLKKGELGLPSCGTWPCVSHMPEAEVSLFSVRSTMGIAHRASIYTTFDR